MSPKMDESQLDVKMEKHNEDTFGICSLEFLN